MWYLETVHKPYLHNLSTPNKKQFLSIKGYITQSPLDIFSSLIAITFLINTQKIISKTRKQLINPFKATERT